MAFEKKKVTIIMGIYNCQDTLEEAIDSLIAQTYTDWNLVMCDDGSSDKTVLVAEKVVEKLPGRVLLLQNRKNKGLLQEWMLTMFLYQNVCAKKLSFWILIKNMILCQHL